jgi:Zn-dependent protease
MRFDKDQRYDVVEPKYSITYNYGPQVSYSRSPKRPFTSSVEIRDIVAAVAILTLAFFWMVYSASDHSVLYCLSLAALSVIVGFLMHELSHKVVARKYGCWAEFRADFRMLGLALVMSFFGFLIAAPGAVMIAGNVTREQNGKISISGPGVNFLAAAILMPFALFTISGISELAQDIAFRLYFFSVFLGAFNMIPLMPFDGAKIWHWNKPVYIITLVAAGLLFYLALARF